MKKTVKISTIEFVSIMELISLPILMLLYESNSYGFWMLLIYLDFMQLYLLDMRQIMLIMKEGAYQDLFKRYKVYSYGLSLCYLVIAFKNSSLCMILIANNLLTTLLNPMVRKLKPNRKK